jgi:hypothetical protein
LGEAGVERGIDRFTMRNDPSLQFHERGHA